MLTHRDKLILAVLLSLLLHAMGALWLAGVVPVALRSRPEAPTPAEKLVYLEVPLPVPVAAEPAALPVAAAPAPASTVSPSPATELPEPAASAVEPVPLDRPRPSMAAPPAPTAEEWAQAAAYTLKNSKRYRYTWGQQVRSMMGTAEEGPDQGVVRFRVEIHPDGRLARLETLWSTSAVAERLARKAIEQMPPLPPTPTGKPLVFEKTIAFQPYATDGPPLYKDDCLPDPPAFRNPFAWNGSSAQPRAAPPPVEPPDLREIEECLKQLPQDSIDAESARDRRELERWGEGSSRGSAPQRAR